MLRCVILDNFIHFQGHQTFHYKPGCNFFIGVNGSGKTSVFEAVRRCAGLSKNASVSSPHFRTKSSAASCIFETGNENLPSSECFFLFSSMIRLPSREFSSPDVFVKLALHTADKIIDVDLVKEIGDAKTLVNCQVKLQNEDAVIKLVLDCVDAATPIGDSSQQFQKLFDEIEMSLKEEVEGFLTDKVRTTVTNTKCEELLEKYIDAKTVFTFSVRGIGVCQWSFSEKMKTEYKRENYNEVQRRAEILKWYFMSVKHHEIAEVEQQRVENYFDIITDHCGYEFQMNQETEELYYLNKKVGRKSADIEDSKAIQKRLSKVPEGIIEAINTSILLGVDCFRTVFLEDPEKGMHPQMIVRMRDLLLRKMSKGGKTIVVSSHHPSFLAPWTIPRLFIFKPNENEYGVVFNVIPGDKIDVFHSDRKLSRVITSDRFSSLFYARRIFFVEGDSDEFLLANLRLLLIDEDEEFLNQLHPAMPYIQSQPVAVRERNTASFREFLSSIQILNMSGETFKERLYKLCRQLDIATMFLHDYDVLYSEKDENKLNQFLTSFSLQETRGQNILDNVGILEEDGFFVWNKCKLENVIKQLADRHPSLRQCLLDNNCQKVANLSPNNQLKKSRDKLFLAEGVTDENITTVVQEIINCCKLDLKLGRFSEMVRLLRFLMRASVKTKSQLLPQTKLEAAAN